MHDRSVHDWDRPSQLHDRVALVFTPPGLRENSIDCLCYNKPNKGKNTSQEEQMTSLALPRPSAPSTSVAGAAPASSTSTAIVSTTTGNAAAPYAPAKALRAPSYEERCRAAAELSKLTPEQRKRNPRKLFVPRSLQDFDDGGAFPEIHVAQYPRHMGNPHLKRKQTSSTNGFQTTSRAIVNVEVDEKGEVSYDAIVKGGTNSDKKVYSRLEDMQSREAKAEDVALPTEEDEQEATNRTQAALQKLLASKTALNKPSGSAMVNAETSKNMEEKTQFIKYTPRPDAPGYNPAAAQRVIQMVPKQVDPMMPPKHKHIKAPRGPAEDPVPVLHAPPQKLTKEERDKWNIPACISNWKNTRGYTIPLDKRLAADGRGLREHTINPNFATLSESLYVAEGQARQEVRMRAQVQKKLALQEKNQREEELRNLANQARLERSGLSGANAPVGASGPAVDSDEEEESQRYEETEDSRGPRRIPSPDDSEINRQRRGTDDDEAARRTGTRGSSP